MMCITYTINDGFSLPSILSLSLPSAFKRQTGHITLDPPGTRTPNNPTKKSIVRLFMVSTGCSFHKSEEDGATVGVSSDHCRQTVRTMSRGEQQALHAGHQDRDTALPSRQTMCLAGHGHVLP